MTNFQVKGTLIGTYEPTYFIADISANHDGDIERAKELIHLAAQAGANAAKFQNFRAEHIVSSKGFEEIGTQKSHQSTWKKTVYEVYEDASIPWEWTPILKDECDKVGIAYFSTPYDLPAVDMLESFVPAYKIGSGDLTWHEICQRIASKGKPVILATGASDIGEVHKAVREILSLNPQLCLMQCNTNYTGSLDNFRYINLRVLQTYAVMYPDIVLGLSDHTPGHTTVLGAVALGARMIEKHFTDDTSRDGPDHPFSMTPASWREMVEHTRELEFALGSSAKEIAPNELDTVIIQRRCVRAARNLAAGTILTRDDLVVLRPAPRGAVQPYEIGGLVGRRTLHAIQKHEHFTWSSVE
ncbi:N-acetylneuraminate synthase family protein [Candidatus Chloroploca asiatica]|uniref:N-acetylneuraminate synthase n=1 Tax=Candidatus Chloroploca asiatica TaxID=1506545 RepID=A0A2H3L0Y1_9CHLR|nr:N-acetylneuraminate synthase family protein [Candidatus Chloroploca asiatica]PDV99986.1 N-acetylneuraminate synthase [Candidatus Chloroploca asiatica]